MIVEFSDTHKPILEKWLLGHGKGTDHINHLPKIGFIAEDEFGFIAAGFLRQIEGCPSMLLDGLIANPMSFGRRRYDALNGVVKKLIKKCEELKISKLLAFSQDTATLKRSIKHGFQSLPHSLIALEIEKGD